MQRGSGGFVTVQFVAAAGLSLVLLTALANVVVAQYGRGVLRAAADEAVRAGARVAVGGDAVSLDRCVSRGEAVLDDLLSGALGRGASVTCRLLGPERLEAEVEALFPAWLPLYPDWPVTATATAVKERAP